MSSPEAVTVAENGRSRQPADILPFIRRKPPYLIIFALIIVKTAGGLSG